MRFKAYRVTYKPNNGESDAFIKAPTASKARYRVYIAWRDFGPVNLRLIDLDVSRRADLDNYDLPTRGGVSGEYLHTCKPKRS